MPLGSSQQEGDLPGQLRTQVRRRRKVTDIATGVQCFATYVGFSRDDPEDIPKLWFTLCGLARTLAAWLGSTMTRPFADRLCLRATDSGKGEPFPVLHLFLRGRPDKQTL